MHPAIHTLKAMRMRPNQTKDLALLIEVWLQPNSIWDVIATMDTKNDIKRYFTYYLTESDMMLNILMMLKSFAKG